MKMKISNLGVSYGKKDVIKDISAIFKGGEMVSVIGPNGAGKTTMVKAVARLTSHRGKVEVTKKDGSKVSHENFTYVPQMSISKINLTVFEMVLLGRIKNLTWKVEQVHLDAVTKILDELRLTPLSYTPFSSLSGGQKQMVIMAQALVSKPKVLILDEPTSALDLNHQLQVMDIAMKYTKKAGAITIIVLHDIGLASRYSDQIVLLNDGYFVKQGNPEQVLDSKLLEKIYNVEVDVSINQNGYVTVTPIRPSSIRRGVL